MTIIAFLHARLKQGSGDSISAPNSLYLFAAEILSPNPCFILTTPRASGIHALGKSRCIWMIKIAGQNELYQGSVAITTSPAATSQDWSLYPNQKAGGDVTGCEW